MDYEDYEDEGLAYAEFVSSWVSGGGRSADADRAWHSGIAHRAGYLSAPEGDYEERPSDRPEFGTPEWDALARLEDEQDYLDELAGF